MIAVEAVPHLGERFAGLFSIEGNLTAEDAYLSGRAADFDDADTFKQHFVDHIWTMAQTHAVMRRYFAMAVLADPVAMWRLGRDARRASVGDGPGRAYGRVQPSLYYWSRASTPETTARWIAQSDSSSSSSRMPAIGHGRSAAGDSTGHLVVFRSEVS